MFSAHGQSEQTLGVGVGVVDLTVSGKPARSVHLLELAPPVSSPPPATINLIARQS